MLSKTEKESGLELNITVAPNQVKQIQDILLKETEGKGNVELISLNKQKATDEIM